MSKTVTVITDASEVFRIDQEAGTLMYKDSPVVYPFVEYSATPGEKFVVILTAADDGGVPVLVRRASRGVVL